METKPTVTRPDVDEKILNEREWENSPFLLQVACGVV
jgi:hypothetical protein